MILSLTNKLTDDWDGWMDGCTQQRRSTTTTIIIRGTITIARTGPPPPQHNMSTRRPLRVRIFIHTRIRR